MFIRLGSLKPELNHKSVSPCSHDPKEYYEKSLVNGYSSFGYIPTMACLRDYEPVHSAYSAGYQNIGRTISAFFPY